MNRQIYFFIYRTTNLKNGKIYVGRHITTDLEDGYIGCGVYRQKDVDGNYYFHNAVRKYGYENFQREILEFCEREELDKREEFWIRELNSTNIEIGYNMTKGGSGFNRSHTEASREKMRQSRSGTRTGKNNTFFGRRHSEESLEKMRRSQKGIRSGENNPNYGKSVSLETRSKISKAALSRKNEVCIYCGSQASPGNIKRWHNDNCKNKK